MRDIRFLLKTHYSNSRALIVGIDKYEKVSPLSYAVSDASEVREILANELGFPGENITYLADADATKSNILKAFFRFANEDVILMNESSFSMPVTVTLEQAAEVRLGTLCHSTPICPTSRRSSARMSSPGTPS
jgi:hypothetical protein